MRVYKFCSISNIDQTTQSITFGVPPRYLYDRNIPIDLEFDQISNQSDNAKYNLIQVLFNKPDGSASISMGLGWSPV